MDLQVFAETIMAAQRKRRHAKHTRPWRPTATPATALGYKCERRIVYQRTESDKADQINEELASIFEEGNLHQVDVRRELADLGYEVVEAELNFRDSRLEITGTIDGKLDLSDEHRARRVPVEIKSSAGSPPDTAEGLRDHKGLYGRYYAQLQVYLFLTSEPEGLFLFKDKITGLWAVVPVALDYDYAEGLLQRAERVRDAIKSGVVPERLADRSECVGCPWQNTICHPEQDAPDPLLLVEDAALVAQLEERERLDPMATRFDALDKEIKTRFKLTAGDRFIAGDAKSGFVIVKKPHGKGVRVDISRLSEAAKEM